MSKKTEEKAPKVIMGRVGTNLEIGIVGLPNVGKSTFFNILTNSQAPAENYPFCTIDPHKSRVLVPDERFDWLVTHWEPAKSEAAVLNVTDIAGLVKGASEGAGLGNKFLSNIKGVDAIFHMIRVFADEDVTHVEGNLDAVRDINIIRKELMLKDIEQMEGLTEHLEKISRTQKEKKIEHECAQKVLAALKEGKEVRHVDWKAQEIEIINPWQLLTAKEVIYLVNMSEKDYLRRKNKFLPAILKSVNDLSGGQDKIIPFSASFEASLQKMDEEGRKKCLEDKKTQSALPKIILAGYEALNLIHFFTAGKKEVKCWTVRKGYKAPQAAGKIHTDFEKTFICCEVMKFEDYKSLGSEAACKANGKYLQQGKNYTVDDGDIIYFKAGAATSKKK